jgi:hypothetical protein
MLTRRGPAGGGPQCCPSPACQKALFKKNEAGLSRNDQAVLWGRMLSVSRWSGLKYQYAIRRPDKSFRGEKDED